MKFIYCKNNRNWEEVQKTLDALPGPKAQVMMEDGKPKLTMNGLVVIQGTEFTEFALKKQGYADVVEVAF